MALYFATISDTFLTVEAVSVNIVHCIEDHSLSMKMCTFVVGGGG